MQTFLPYPNFKQSLKCLDRSRLGKQRSECLIMINALRGASKGWVNHPATRMWAGYEEALMVYHNMCIDEWESRGYVNNMEKFIVDPRAVKMPHWWGDTRLHSSHRAALMFKAPDHYNKFGWTEEAELNYFWPSKHSYEKIYYSFCQRGV